MAAMPRPDDRSDARERALYLLYEAYSKGITPADALALQVLEPDALTTLLVVGVGEHVHDGVADGQHVDGSVIWDGEHGTGP
jgi:N utilization substance protein B